LIPDRSNTTRGGRGRGGRGASRGAVRGSSAARGRGTPRAARGRGAGRGATGRVEKRTRAPTGGAAQTQAQLAAKKKLLKAKKTLQLAIQVNISQFKHT
jgi:hypothetical protein